MATRGTPFGPIVYGNVTPAVINGPFTYAGFSSGSFQNPGTYWTRYEWNWGSSSKFWEFVVNDATLLIHWGRTGTEGKTMAKQFPSRYEAATAAYAIIRSKIGYRKVETP